MKKRSKNSKKSSPKTNALAAALSGKSTPSSTKGGFWNWLDNNLLLLLSGFLLAFIPLYPKLPLFELITGYIVRVRLEDLLILLTGVVWLVQLKRKNVTLRTPLTPLIIAYAIVGLLSTLSALFVSKTVLLNPVHTAKTVLHYFRYLEYFSLFFFAYSAIRSRKDVITLLSISSLTTLGVIIYGFGQRYLYWPVYSTMNREFSTGMRLYLEKDTRVNSTFGGHYDLAAYLVILLPLLLGTAFMATKKVYKLFAWVVFTGGIWLLLMTASRSSLAGYALGLVVVLSMFAFTQKTIRQKIWWFLSRFFLVGFINWVMIAYFGASMYERILQTLEPFPALHQTYHGINAARKEFMFVTIPHALGLKELPSYRFEVEKPANGIGIVDSEVLVSSDKVPVTDKPSDVTVDVPDYKQEATISADGTVQIITVARDRTWSDNALKYGLSMAIRLDTLWPRALQGFYSNPLLGTGYATLTRDTPYHFTEADSTDNNFLRVLGETGLAGFLTFFGIILISNWYSLRLFKNSVQTQNKISLTVAAAFIAGSLGLLVNAVLIDVFAASKVAQIYWAFAGIVMALYSLELARNPKKS